MPDVREPAWHEPATDDEMQFLAALHCPDLDEMRLTAFRMGWHAATYYMKDPSS